MKTRMSLVDVIAVVRELQVLVGYRVNNVYDLNAKTYLMKLHKSGGGTGNTSKAQLLMESGTRLHLTRFDHAKSDSPSGFAMKLRKHIRNSKLSGIRQLGKDRVIDFQFGYEAKACHIILELYASGNIILTDSSYTILTLLRRHTYDGDVKVAVREVYPVAVAARQEDLVARTTADGGDGGGDGGGGDGDGGASAADSFTQESLAAFLADMQSRQLNRKQRNKSGLKQVLSSTGSGVDYFGPLLLEHACAVANVDANRRVCAGQPELTEAEVAALYHALCALPALLAEMDGHTPQGFIVCKDAVTEHVATDAATTGAATGVIPSIVPDACQPVDFTPQLFAQHRPPHMDAARIIEVPTFNRAVDEYFAHVAGLKVEKQEKQVKKTHVSKADKVRLDQQKRIDALQAKQRAAVMKAQRIQLQPQLVDHAIKVVRSALESGMDWADLERLIDSERQRGDPIASMISGLDLARDCFFLRLRDPTRPDSDSDSDSSDSSDEEDGQGRASAASRRAAAGAGANAGAGAADEDEDEEEDGSTGKPRKVKGSKRERGKRNKRQESAKRRVKKLRLGDDSDDELELDDGQEEPKYVNVRINLKLTAHANAAEYFSTKKTAAAKESRTAQAAAAAVKAAQKRDAKKGQAGGGRSSKRKGIRVPRKPFWFEKFQWMITSDKVIVIGGKDAQQNELLVKRYLRPQDLYVHADLHGASTVIIRNPNNDPGSADKISETAKLEAGAFTVCFSAAWKANTPSNAWWVYANQVSKTAPAGEYLSTGSFMIRGRKNMLPPCKLELALALLWQVDGAPAVEDGGDASGAGQVEGLDESKDSSVAVADSTVDIVAVAAAEATAGADSHDGEADAADDDEGDDGEGGDDDDDGSDDDGDGDSDVDAGDGDDDGGDHNDEHSDGANETAPPPPHAVDAPAGAGASPPTLPAGGRRKSGGSATAVTRKARAEAERKKRGQHGRAKRRAKYADQDEEDRRLALLALGHEVDVGNDAAAAPAPSPAPATDAAAVPTPVEYSAEEVAEREKMRKLMAGRGDLVPGISNTDGDAGVIAGLLPTVPEGATIVNVVAVCAPLTSVMACKYKVRLLPGKLKKGKTAKAAMHMMETWSQCSGREKEFVKGLVDEDVVRVVVGDASVALPPGGGATGGKGKGGGGKGGGKGKGKGGGKKKTGGRRRAGGANKRANRRG